MHCAHTYIHIHTPLSINSPSSGLDKFQTRPRATPSRPVSYSPRLRSLVTFSRSYFREGAGRVSRLTITFPLEFVGYDTNKGTKERANCSTGFSIGQLVFEIESRECVDLYVYIGLATK